MTENAKPELKTSIFAIFLLVNGVALFCLLNPWLPDWQEQATLLLILESIFLVVIGLPVFFYHFFKHKKPFKQSLADSLDTVLDFLCGWV